MAEIKVLSEDTIDKIAAGEVVERPMSVVKELVENAMDAGSTVVTVEIKNGGIDFIRVSDNGQGIAADQVRLAFARHATSKIRSAEDLTSLMSMGFRGEALSSIAAVAQVELITKTKDALTGVRYVMEGAIEKDFEEIGAPEGTTFLVKNLFYNTPVRRKFLKQPQTEAGYVAELLERLALSRPDISFKFIQNGQVKFHTPGNNDLKEVIYRIYGREIAAHLMPIDAKADNISIKGFLGKPEINRSNRNFEHYFINSRYVKSKVLAKAIEDGYKQYVMQHKFPFVVLHFSMSGSDVDVNVHPTKMEVRFSDEVQVYKTVMQSILTAFRSKELIVNAGFGKEERVSRADNMPRYEKEKLPEPFIIPNSSTPQTQTTLQPFDITFDDDLAEAKNQKPETKPSEVKNPKPEAKPSEAKNQKPEIKPSNVQTKKPEVTYQFEEVSKQVEEAVSKQVVKEAATEAFYHSETDEERNHDLPAGMQSPEMPPFVSAFVRIQIAEAEQTTLFEEQFLTEKAKESYDILGQIFGTYWIVSYSDRMYMIDQHAAHEKVKYERLIAAAKKKEILTQNILPPVVLQVSAREEQVVLDHMDDFAGLGFEIEEFGDHAFVLRAVPVDLYGVSFRELFREILDELMEEKLTGSAEVVLNKLASMACKAAVKGNTNISRPEAEKLIDELLTLENPYHCPHGRPTIISMTKQEIEKKFKRIV